MPAQLCANPQAMHPTPHQSIPYQGLLTSDQALLKKNSQPLQQMQVKKKSRMHLQLPVLKKYGQHLLRMLLQGEKCMDCLPEPDQASM